MCKFLIRTSRDLRYLLLILLLLGCSKDKSASLTDFFPNADALPYWTRTDQVETFDQDNLYDLVNGQAESFFAYRFEQVAVQDYENSDGAVLYIEIWQLETSADAYGLFTTSIAGTPVDIGMSGDADPGRRLVFWQDRYYVHVRARPKLPGADLQAFAVAVSEALPSGGLVPSLIDRLPIGGLVPHSEVFFHHEISIQNELWLGGENVLGLGPETDGVLARYDLGGGMAQLLLVQYPSPDAASAGLAALENTLFNNLMTTRARDNLLGAVFGDLDRAAADKLLKEALP